MRDAMKLRGLFTTKPTNTEEQAPPSMEESADPKERLDYYARGFLRNALIKVVGRNNERDGKITLEKILPWASAAQKEEALKQVETWLRGTLAERPALPAFMNTRRYPAEMIRAAYENLKKEVLDTTE